MVLTSLFSPGTGFWYLGAADLCSRVHAKTPESSIRKQSTWSKSRQPAD